MESFLSANPGMARRIAHKFHFEDFSTAELAQIFARKARDKGLNASDEANKALAGLIDAHFPSKIRSLWNAGLASRLISEAVQCLNRRLDPCTATRAELSTLELCDLIAGSKCAAEAVCALSSAFAEDGIDKIGEDGPGGEGDMNAGDVRKKVTEWRGSGRGVGDMTAKESKGHGDARSGHDRGKDLDLLSTSLINTLHLKQYWPSALKRIAALELQLQQVPTFN